MVIVDTRTKVQHIFELTMLLMANIESTHNKKTNKYLHFLSDVLSAIKLTLLLGFFTAIQTFSLCLFNPSKIGQRTSANIVLRQQNKVECFGGKFAF